MQWVSSEGMCYYEWTNQAGDVMRHRDFFGGQANRERGSRPEGVPLKIEDTPQLFLTRRPPSNVIEPHFHEMPQFQVFCEGSGRIGKHSLRPLVVHWTDAYTPYGPIVADPAEGLAFLTIRGKSSNGGAHYMPQARHRLVRKAGRALTAEVELGRARNIIPLTDDGVEASLLAIDPGDVVAPPASAANGGRFFIVMDGSLVHDQVQLDRYASLHVRPEDPAPELRAGSAGAQVLALQFPPYA